MLAAKKEELKNHLSKDVTTSWYINGLRFTVKKVQRIPPSSKPLKNDYEYEFTFRSLKDYYITAMTPDNLTEENLKRLAARARAAIIEEVNKTEPGSNLKKIIKSIKKEVK